MVAGLRSWRRAHCRSSPAGWSSGVSDRRASCGSVRDRHAWIGGGAGAAPCHSEGVSQGRAGVTQTNPSGLSRTLSLLSPFGCNEVRQMPSVTCISRWKVDAFAALRGRFRTDAEVEVARRSRLVEPHLQRIAALEHPALTDRQRGIEHPRKESVKCHHLPAQPLQVTGLALGALDQTGFESGSECTGRRVLTGSDHQAPASLRG